MNDSNDAPPYVGSILCLAHLMALVEKIDSLRTAFLYVKELRPFQINAAVIMPDHLHCIWTLPPDDADFSIRCNLLKGHFSRAIAKGERISQSRSKRRERGLS